MDRRAFLATSAGAVALAGCPNPLRRRGDRRPRVYVSTDAVTFVPNASHLVGQVRADGFDASGFGDDDAFSATTGRFSVGGTDAAVLRFDAGSLRGLAFTVEGRPCDVFRNGELVAEDVDSFSRRFGGDPALESAPATDTGGPGFDTDFDFRGDRLAAHGWHSVDGAYTTRDSHLVSTGTVGRNSGLYRRQPLAAGRYVFRGVRNAAHVFGLKTLFVADDRRYGPARGYGVSWRQTRRGDVVLVRRDGDDGEVLLTLTEDHAGEPTDVTVVRDPDTYEFEAFLDGESVGTVRDDTYTTSQYWVQRHDATVAMAVDGLAALPP